MYIDGVPYLFGYSGAQKTDWQTVDEKRWYYDPESGMPVFGWLDYFGKRYYIDSEEGKLTGQQLIGKKALLLGAGSDSPTEEHYCFDEDGSLLTGRFFIDEKPYYSDPETGLCAAGSYMELGSVFFTDETGAFLTGWQEIDGKRYYLSEETGYAQYGLFEVDGNYYLGRPDGLYYGEYWLDGDRCFFDEETGILKTGWFSLDGAMRYFDVETMHGYYSEFDEIDGNRYYFNEAGEAVTGLQEIDGQLYYFDENAVMQTGMQEIDGTLRYFDPETGVAVIGAVETEDGTVRFDAEGQVFGWEKTAEGNFYTNDEGFVTPGWQTVGDKDYKFDENGMQISDGRLYNQLDSQWTKVAISKTSTSTMKSSACGIFSFCNAIFSLNRNEADAVEVATWAYSINAYRPGAGGTYREILYNNIEQEYGEKLHFTLNGQIWGKITDSRLKNHLLGGGVAVIHVSGHFMAVTGYNPETGLYHVLESACSKKRGLEGDSWVTAEKMSSGYTNVDWFVLISNRDS